MSIRFVKTIEAFLDKKISEGKIKQGLSGDGQTRVAHIEKDLNAKKIDLDNAIEAFYSGEKGKRDYHLYIGGKNDREELKKMFK